MLDIVYRSYNQPALPGAGMLAFCIPLAERRKQRLPLHSIVPRKSLFLKTAKTHFNTLANLRKTRVENAEKCHTLRH